MSGGIIGNAGLITLTSSGHPVLQPSFGYTSTEPMNCSPLAFRPSALLSLLVQRPCRACRGNFGHIDSFRPCAQNRAETNASVKKPCMKNDLHVGAPVPPTLRLCRRVVVLRPLVHGVFCCAWNFEDKALFGADVLVVAVHLQRIAGEKAVLTKSHSNLQQNETMA